jgi:transposase-like protein
MSGVNGTECPECGSAETPVKIGGWDVDSRRIRRRQCRECNFWFVTVEVPVMLDDGRPIPYSWLDEHYRLKAREAARERYTRSGGGKYRGLKTKRPIEGVASLDVTVRVRLPSGMRPDARHGTAEPVPNYRTEDTVAPQRLIDRATRLEIVRRYLDGVPTDALARVYRISTRTIQRYVARYGEEAA